ncbi:MAG: energy-dependent translational throttle protein EttA [Emcibacteraceae bacterium]|nr:energy-dependent translational throttle protein EttA [Emcibacteraceae bacterium]MDG1727030.1 energy-dependent translational throttle protein EttA [Emcibacteraceae bacterium]
MASYQYSYVMKGVGKTYAGAKPTFSAITLSFLPDAKIAVIGVNGAGKSTLMKIIAGIDTDYVGEAWAAEGIRVGYLEQEPQLDPKKTVFENVMDGMSDLKAIVDEFNEISGKFAEPMSDDEMNDLIARQGELQDQIDAADAWDLDSRVELAMEALRCPPKDSDVTVLSGGERRRVALCRLLLEKPEILLLDEPTNHLDAESVSWLENHLQEYAGTVILVTHDRYFLDNVVNWVLELDRGRAIPYEGHYSAWLEQKEKRLLQEERMEAGRKRTMKRELKWIQQSPKARQAKSKARINAYDDLLAAAQEGRNGEAQIQIPVGPRLGGVVIEADKLSKGFDDRLLIDELDFKLPPGGIVGIIGANGAGKSTLFKMITGGEKPDSGSIRVGETVLLGHVDQSREGLDDNKSVWEEISDGLDVFDFNGRKVPTRAYVGNFNFKGTDQQKKLGQLSGGERNRVHLAKMLRTPANVLLLDEPTNDLDVETLSALEASLEDFAGCAVIISHDRWFLNRIATHILAFEGNSHVEWFEGNYEDYEADRRRRLGDAADRPTKMQYKKLTR